MNFKQRLIELLDFAVQSARDSVNNKIKKWTFFTILFFILLSLDDYSVVTLSIPPFEQLNVTNGVLKIEQITGGKGGSGGDILHLLNSDRSMKFRCRINTRDESKCISKSDARFYDKTPNGESWLGKSATIKPNTSKIIRHARAWWYEGNIFWILKEKRLLQLDVEGERVIGYEQQKAKYMLKKNNYDYIPTILLIFSIIWFFVLQLASQSLNLKKEQ